MVYDTDTVLPGMDFRRWSQENIRLALNLWRYRSYRPQ